MINDNSNSKTPATKEVIVVSHVETSVGRLHSSVRKIVNTAVQTFVDLISFARVPKLSFIEKVGQRLKVSS